MLSANTSNVDGNKFTSYQRWDGTILSVNPNDVALHEIMTLPNTVMNAILYSNVEQIAYQTLSEADASNIWNKNEISKCQIFCTNSTTSNIEPPGILSFRYNKYLKTKK